MPFNTIQGTSNELLALRREVERLKKKKARPLHFYSNGPAISYRTTPSLNHGIYPFVLAQPMRVHKIRMGLALTAAGPNITVRIGIYQAQLPLSNQPHSETDEQDAAQVAPVFTLVREPDSGSVSVLDVMPFPRPYHFIFNPSLDLQSDTVYALAFKADSGGVEYACLEIDNPVFNTAWLGPAFAVGMPTTLPADSSLTNAPAFHLYSLEGANYMR